jgi:hypothetical protein
MFGIIFLIKCSFIDCHVLPGHIYEKKRGMNLKNSISRPCLFEVRCTADKHFIIHVLHYTIFNKTITLVVTACVHKSVRLVTDTTTETTDENA